jgi:hypothetical protein
MEQSRKLKYDDPAIDAATSVAAPRRPAFFRIGMALALAVPVLVAAVALVTPGHRHGASSTPATTPHAALISPSQRLADGTISC